MSAPTAILSLKLAIFLGLIAAYALYTCGSSIQSAYADGLWAENLPPTTLQGKEAQLFVRINPPVLTSATQQDAFMQFRLFDAKTGETFKWTTYYIEVTKGTASSDQSIVHDAFQAPDGLLTLKIQPSEGPLTIFGDQDQFLSAWVADPGGTINVRGPLLLDGGLYHFHIEIIGIDHPRGLLQNVTKFDSYLSVGDFSSQDIKYEGQNYNTTIISYYDKIQDFKFDPAKKTFDWEMPFDWNVSRIQQNNIFVHEEVRIPKSLRGIGDSPYYFATANGDVLTGRKLAIDPYSYGSEMTIHYLLNKNDILRMASKIGDSKIMTFSLAPASEVPVETTSEMVTDTGGLGVGVEWSPNPLNADSESTVKLHFSDAFSGSPLNADVQYSVMVLDDSGKLIYTKDNLTAKVGTDTQTIDFPSNKIYNFQVAVTGLMKEGQQVDETRNGVARGIVIVPEFPMSSASTFLVIATIVGILVILLRRSASIYGRIM